MDIYVAYRERDKDVPDESVTVQEAEALLLMYRIDRSIRHKKVALPLETILKADYYKYVVALAELDMDLLDFDSGSDVEREAKLYKGGAALAALDYLSDHPGNPVARAVIMGDLASTPAVHKAFYRLIAPTIEQFVVQQEAELA